MYIQVVKQMFNYNKNIRAYSIIILPVAGVIYFTYLLTYCAGLADVTRCCYQNFRQQANYFTADNNVRAVNQQINSG